MGCNNDSSINDSNNSDPNSSNDRIRNVAYNDTQDIFNLVPMTAGIVMPVKIKSEYENRIKQEIINYICSPKFEWNCDTALHIVWRESRGIATEINNTCVIHNNICHFAHGIFQILLPLHSDRFLEDENPLNFKNNTNAAYRLYLDEGWIPWE